jgi:hypothetical protein
MLTYFGLEVPRLSFTLQPQINGVAANVKMLAGFTAFHAIEFDRLYDFLAQVVAVGFGHDRNGSKSGRAFLFYVLTLMATAITLILKGRKICLFCHRLNVETVVSV